MADFKRPWGYLGKRRHYFYPTLYTFSFMYSTRQLHKANPFYYVTSSMLILTMYLKIKTKECNWTRGSLAFTYGQNTRNKET